MSKYTTELRYICEVNSGLDESVGYNDVENVIANSRTKIFDFDYPIFDVNYKSVLETKILKHYYTREIGAETVGLWKLWLNSRMNEIMPYYNKLYESELIKFDPMRDYDLTKDGKRSGNDNTVNGGNDVVTNQASGEDVVTNQTSGNDVVTNQASGNDNVTSQTSGNDVVSEQASGNDTTRNRASGSDVVTKAGSGENVGTTEYGGSDTINTAEAVKLNKWDMYSDTPQGDIIAMDNDQYRYLTNARHITEDGTGTTRNETKNYGQTIETSNEYSDNATETTAHGKQIDETITYGKKTQETTTHGKKIQEITTHGKKIEETTTHGKKTEETTTHGKTVEETTKHGKTVDVNSTEEYLEHIYGKISGTSYSKLLEEYRNTLLNIDVLVIRDLADLFFNLW